MNIAKRVARKHLASKTEKALATFLQEIRDTQLALQDIYEDMTDRNSFAVDPEAGSSLADTSKDVAEAALKIRDASALLHHANVALERARRVLR